MPYRVKSPNRQVMLVTAQMRQRGTAPWERLGPYFYCADFATAFVALSLSDGEIEERPA